MLSVPWCLDAGSVLLGALTGSLIGCQRGLDVVGVTVAGLLTGYAGGLIRDLLLGGKDIYLMEHAGLLWACLGVCVATFLLRSPLARHGQLLFAADTLSVALYSLVGANKVLAYGLDPLYVALLGCTTAVGGGVVRDASCGMLPAVFRPSNFYALACLAGSASFAVLAAAGVPLAWAGVCCVGMVLSLRYLSVWRGWRTHGGPWESAVLRLVRDLVAGGGGSHGRSGGRGRT